MEKMKIIILLILVVKFKEILNFKVAKLNISSFVKKLDTNEKKELIKTPVEKLLNLIEKATLFEDENLVIINKKAVASNEEDISNLSLKESEISESILEFMTKITGKKQKIVLNEENLKEVKRDNLKSKEKDNIISTNINIIKDKITKESNEEKMPNSSNILKIDNHIESTKNHSNSNNEKFSNRNNKISSNKVNPSTTTTNSNVNTNSNTNSNTNTNTNSNSNNNNNTKPNVVVFDIGLDRISSLLPGTYQSQSFVSPSINYKENSNFRDLILAKTVPRGSLNFTKPIIYQRTNLPTLAEPLAPKPHPNLLPLPSYNSLNTDIYGFPLATVPISNNLAMVTSPIY